MTVDQPDHVNPYLALSFMCDRFAFLRRLLGSKVPSIALTVQGPSRGMIKAYRIHCSLLPLAHVLFRERETGADDTAL